MSDLLHPWLAAAALLAPLHWVARWRGWMRVGVVTKPLVMIVLILWSLSQGAWQGDMWWIGVGLLLSLGGDVALLLPRRLFPLGLFFFLIAHLCFMAGFCLPVPTLHPILVPLTSMLAIGALFYFRNLITALRAKAYRKRFIAPLLLYGLIVAMMALSACQTLLRPDWPLPAATLASLGGMLFLLSDSLLAYNRFVSPLPGGKTFEMMTYHLAQAAIIAGALLRWP